MRKNIVRLLPYGFEMLKDRERTKAILLAVLLFTLVACGQEQGGSLALVDADAGPLVAWVGTLLSEIIEAWGKPAEVSEETDVMTLHYVVLDHSAFQDTTSMREPAPTQNNSGIDPKTLESVRHSMRHSCFVDIRLRKGDPPLVIAVRVHHFRGAECGYVYAKLPNESQ